MRVDMSSAMSSIPPLRFTGVSSFSTDLQAIIDRAGKIAALPVQQLQNQQSALISKKQSLTALNGNLQGLTSAVEKLGELGRTRSLAVSSSNANRVTVINNGISSSTSYQITEITSVAKAAAETTLTGLATPDATAVDSDDSLELLVGDETFTLDLSGGNNNLEGLRDAINSAGAGVTATVLNTGLNNYLSITANATGAKALQVRATAGDAGSNILSATNQGANAIFKLNGLDVEQSDNVISEAIPGLTFTIVDETDPDETVTLTASSSRNGLSAALSAFVENYNATREKLNLQIGQNAGLLSGDFLVGAWRIARTGSLNKALSNAVLKLRGFPMPSDLAATGR
jgi:flagellar hook-associated protein 2